MASSVPQEVLSLIVQHVAKVDKKLSTYASVNKSWQAAFEKQIYASLVVLSPSDVISPDKRREKRGLPLASLVEITSGPQEWRRARRTYVRRVFYRVIVPYWLSDAREKDEGYTYDNFCRRENNHAFSDGVRQLFGHLSAWTNQAISLDIALQAESASTDEEDGEPGSTPTTGTEDEIAPYYADFSPDCSLPRATCITSLNFPDVLTSAMVLGENDAPDLPCHENKISLPAVLKIASACGALQKIRLDGDDIPLTEPNMRMENRIATADGLSRLPSSIRNIAFCWSSPSEYDIPEFRSPNESGKQDALCVALQKTSMQLQHLHIEDLEVFPELFCPNGPESLIEAHWPHLETLRLDRISDLSPFGGVSRYADGSTPEEPLIERYINELYTSLGYAAQKMPRLKRVNLNFAVTGHELKLLFRDDQWKLTVCVYGNYKPSSQFLEAWKVPGRSLKPCKGRGWQQAIYTSWPPS